MPDAIGSRREFLKASSAVAAGAILVSGDAPQAKAKNISVAPLLMTAGASFDGGDLKGRFVYDGTAPERKPVVITADKDFCGKQNILEENLVVNPAKGKKLTNIRAAGSDENVVLTTPIQMSLEESISYINDDELVEITPQAVRLRKRPNPARRRAV